MDRQLEQTMALAGIAQCAFLVRQLAHHGLAATDKFSVAVDSLFVLDPKNAMEVFGTLRNLNLGLQSLQEILDGAHGMFSSDEVLRYILNILHLHGKLKQREAMLRDIRGELEQLRGAYPDTLVAGNQQLVRDLANLYQRTISTLPFRIQVRGDILRLQNETLAAKIRVMLFAGIRAAVLWDQLGGRRWHLLFLRKRLRGDIARLIRMAG